MVIFVLFRRHPLSGHPCAINAVILNMAAANNNARSFFIVVVIYLDKIIYGVFLPPRLIWSYKILSQTGQLLWRTDSTDLFSGDAAWFLQTPLLWKLAMAATNRIAESLKSKRPVAWIFFPAECSCRQNVPLISSLCPRLIFSVLLLLFCCKTYRFFR